MYYEIAPLYKRVYAYLLDLTFVSMVELQFATVIPAKASFLLLIPGLMYFIISVSSNWQATPGQRLMKIYIVYKKQQKIPWVIAMDRHLAQLLLPILIIITALFSGTYDAQIEKKISSIQEDSWLTFLILILLYSGILMWYGLALFNKQKQTIHDLIFKTIVVKGRRVPPYSDK